jgi:hypothetical protein
VPEQIVLEDNDLARVQLMPENWLCLPCARISVIKIGLGAFADPIEDVKYAKLLVIIMGGSHNVGEGPKKVHAKRTVGLSLEGWHEPEESANERLAPRVRKEPNTRVVARARHPSPVRDRNGLVLPHGQVIISPLVSDDVSGSSAVGRLIAFITA